MKIFVVVHICIYIFENTENFQEKRKKYSEGNGSMTVIVVVMMA